MSKLLLSALYHFHFDFRFWLDFHIRYMSMISQASSFFWESITLLMDITTLKWWCMITSHMHTHWDYSRQVQSSITSRKMLLTTGLSVTALNPEWYIPNRENGNEIIYSINLFVPAQRGLNVLIRFQQYYHRHLTNKRANI